MLRIPVLAILVLSDLCLTIRVPVDWDSDSEVKHETDSTENTQKPIPAEYFVYTAEKPQFAVDIAAFHGVKSPEHHYKAYPIKPYTGQEKPEYGKHKLYDENKTIFKPYQEYAQKEALRNPTAPAAINYEVYHPYKAEEPAFQQIYKDPILEKIRNDIRESQNRLQKYENDAGKPDITEDEYLESIEQTDRKKLPHTNVPARYEIHRPQRRPVYYRPPPKFYYRDQVLNRKFKHPWNQHDEKIRPVHYEPIKHHIHRLRQHHALKYDDERNQYPQDLPSQNYAEPVDGFDIYERGKDKYLKLRNNVDESINKAVQENRPTIYQKLELQNNGDRTEMQISDDIDDKENDDDEEFVPIKSYAQVRKTETSKHLPKSAAYNDAENFDEIKNAPRLREAIKSTKAQTVYTEEGYEDAAYDHAGEQKHASEVEGHEGYLKEKEISAGKFKIPSVAVSYQDGSGNEYRDLTEHGKKWKNDEKDKDEETKTEDYSEDENDHSVEDEIYEDITGERNKRDSEKDPNEYTKSETLSDHSSQNNTEHEVAKRETQFKVPEINLNSTFLLGESITNISRLRTEPEKENIKDKYPYYFKNLKLINKNSPLRYAENLRFIPKKSKGGTEFYDSRSKFQCPEVDDNVDPIPEKLKKDGHPDSVEEDSSEESSKKKGQADFDHLKKNHRLKGLGDKIDCFKAKFFGENPLDSPFFKEDIISNPEPVTLPNLTTFKLKSTDPHSGESKSTNIFELSENLKGDTNTDVFILLDRLRNEQNKLQESLVKSNNDLKSTLIPPNNLSFIVTPLTQNLNIYPSILDTNTNLKKPIELGSTIQSKQEKHNEPNITSENVTYISFRNIEHVTKPPVLQRKKRGAPFVYEPYKIIRDGQVQESKKTTTTSNISPLIKQLQSSKVVDKVTKLNHEDQPVKRQSSYTYKDIGRKERAKNGKSFIESSGDAFVDVKTDQRRGEPRYELRHTNHKSEYTPVENKKSMSIEDYKNVTNNAESKFDKQKEDTLKFKQQPKAFSRQKSSRDSTTLKPYFDVSQFLPNYDESHKTSASNTVTRVVSTTLAPKLDIKLETTKEEDDDIEEDEDYEEYDDDDETPLSTTTTTPKPSFRKRRVKVSTTTPRTDEEETELELPKLRVITPKTKDEEETELELPKLRLVTRFRNHEANIEDKNNKKHIETSTFKNQKKEPDLESPKYTEKKKKSSKSTLVTDEKTYGDDDDDMRKDEVDAMIGVKDDMDEYMPHYEKRINSKGRKESSSGEDEEDYDDDDNEDDDDEDEDDDEEEENSDDDDDFDDDEEEDEQEASKNEPKTATQASVQTKTIRTTTPEPTKRTLIRTTDAPPSTTESRSAKLQNKPIIVKKKIEIHKEFPVNKSSPHLTQFKQDIKEVEIIKEIPSKKHPMKKLNKNIEALELYKDDNLAKDINTLGGVEVFKANLDLRTGPKHGGNYRSAKLLKTQQISTSTSQPHRGRSIKTTKGDAETSQSEYTKLVDMGDELPARRLHGGNLKSINDAVTNSPSTAKNAKLELVDYIAEVVTESPHDNAKSNRHNGRRRARVKNSKLIEFDDRDDDDSRNKMHGGNFQSYDSSIDDDRSSHGSGFRSRSAKLIKADDSNMSDTTRATTHQTTHRSKGETSTHARIKSAGLLNSFVQAAPILTTTPAYILDPSKRMYYYVDA